MLHFFYTRRNNVSIRARRGGFIMMCVCAAPSGPVERVFSHLRRVFDGTQEGAMQGRPGAAVMLRHNKRKAWPPPLFFSEGRPGGGGRERPARNAGEAPAGGERP